MHWKKSILVIEKILRLFVNTLAVNEEHYLLTRDNLTRTIQIQLSQKQKTFSQFHFAFLKSILNYKHFPKKMTLRADVFPEIPSPKNMVWLMSKKSCFRRPLDREHGKSLETMFQSEWQHLYKYINYYERSSISKSRFSWYKKS